MKTKLSIFCEKIIEAGWLAAVVAVPLFFNIYTARTFEPDKITLLRSITAVMILAWLVMVIEQGFQSEGQSIGRRFRVWVRQPLVLPVLAMVVVYIISTIFSISPKVSLWGSYQRLQGTYSMFSYMVVFALMAAHLRTREQVDRLVTLVIVASVPVSLYGIIQRFGLDPLPWAGNVTIRVASNMGNAIFVASYLIMIIPVTLVRLLESMTAIIQEENASWGHTILAAVYIFTIAIQIIAVIFSQSRGPMLGVMGASFIMGMLVLLILRRLDSARGPLSVREIGAGLLFLLPLGAATAILGGAGFLIGSLLSFDNAKLLGAALGGLLGLFGGYTYMAVAGKGHRWMWLSWLGLAAVGIAFVLMLNVRGTGLDPVLDPVREMPLLSRLSRVTDTSSTGKVRILIWDAAMQLIAPHGPIGITEETSGAKPDAFNAVRPLIGYGPESMFNAFAYVYPPGLAHVENRGSSADRSHNETMDSLVITGVLGFVAFYFLMVSVFYYALKWLGWVPDKSAARRLVALLLIFAAIGAVIPYLVQGRFTFAPVGLPFGLISGMLVFVIWQGIATQPDLDTSPALTPYTLLLIGLLGAITGHFIEVHFVFSIAATYTYFWAYLGLMLALSKMVALEASAAETGSTPETLPAETPPPAEVTAAPRRARKGRARRGKRKSAPATAPPVITATGARRENWETWLGSQGLAMAIVLIILTFDFVTPQFQLTLGNSSSASFIWMLVITWLAGFAIALSNLAVRRDDWPGNISWGRATMLYGITSLSYFFFYTLAHRFQFGQRITVTSIEDVVRAAGVLAGGLVVFYIFLLLLMVIIALTLSWGRLRGLAFWRSENWWLYPPLVIFFFVVPIWLQNINVVRADIYLKEGERYRNNRQWNEAIALHEKARSLDSDDDFYYLMQALDYQLMAQDNRLDEATRQNAWQQGERIALEARDVNPYNPDNTGNMGRYYFTLGQVFDQSKFQDALEFFKRATELAPSNVIYHNLWAQTYYILQDYPSAIDRLETSISIDGKYPPTWILLGDTYAAMGNVDEALNAHAEGMNLAVRGSDGWATFADQFLDQRLNFYISAGRGNDIIAAMQQVALNRPNDARIPWAIGHAYELMSQTDKALTYFEQARNLGDTSDRTTRSMANIYLAANQYEQAVPLYQTILQKQPNDIEAHSALAFIYAQQGRIDEAILHNQKVVEQSPNDYDSLKNLAILYQQQQNYPQAMTYAQQAQAVSPEAEKASWEQFIGNLQNLMNAGN